MLQNKKKLLLEMTSVFLLFLLLLLVYRDICFASEKTELPTIVTGTENSTLSESETEVVEIPVDVLTVSAGMGVLVLLIAASMIYIYVKGKKQKDAESVLEKEVYREPVVETEEPPTDACHGETQYVLWNRDRVSNDKTVVLVEEERESSKSFIVLEDQTNSNRLLSAEIENRIVIGRKSGEIQIPDDSAISGRHCEITKEGKKYYICDLNSANGTKLRNKRISGKTSIMDGDEIAVGRHRFVVRMKNGA